MLMGVPESDPEGGKYLRVFQEALRALGWRDRQNVQIDYRAAADLEGLRSRALELIGLGPEFIVTYTTPATNAVRQVTRSVPILFVAVSDPIGTGFVESFSRPGGNITGFTNFEATMGGKWVDLLRDVVPSVKRVGMLFNPTTANAGASGGVYLPSMKAAAGVLGLELSVSPVSDPADIDHAFAAMAEKSRWRLRCNAKRFHCCEPRAHCGASGPISRSDCLSASALCHSRWSDVLWD